MLEIPPPLYSDGVEFDHRNLNSSFQECDAKPLLSTISGQIKAAWLSSDPSIQFHPEAQLTKLPANYKMFVASPAPYICILGHRSGIAYTSVEGIGLFLFFIDFCNHMIWLILDNNHAYENCVCSLCISMCRSISTYSSPQAYQGMMPMADAYHHPIQSHLGNGMPLQHVPRQPVIENFEKKYNVAKRLIQETESVITDFNSARILLF